MIKSKQFLTNEALSHILFISHMLIGEEKYELHFLKFMSISYFDQVIGNIQFLHL